MSRDFGAQLTHQSQVLVTSRVEPHARPDRYLTDPSIRKRSIDNVVGILVHNRNEYETSDEAQVLVISPIPKPPGNIRAGSQGRQFVLAHRVVSASIPQSGGLLIGGRAVEEEDDTLLFVYANGEVAICYLTIERFISRPAFQVVGNICVFLLTLYFRPLTV